MAASANVKKLLYVTLPTNGSVDVFSYPQGELEGQLTGFSYPYGDCTDEKGNVYITDYNRNAVVEYAHGGTEPVRTLSLPGTGPWSCAVDPGGGNLAVTDAGTVSGAGADLAIYRKARGAPKTYTDPAIFSYAFCAYDDAGDLYVDGIPAKGYGYDFELAELEHGGKSLKAVSLEYGTSWNGALQWDRNYLTVGQPVPPHILRYTMSAGYGTYAGSTTLTDAYEARQFIIAGGKAVVVNQYYVDRYIARWDVLVFNYPAGGSETTDFLEPYTIVGSVALSHRKN
jgi:DNA-binding beta-propeller fold protein YncE